MRCARPRFFAVIVSVSLAAAADAAPVLDALFGDHAVLQGDKPVPVWGRADPGEHVSVTFAGQAVGALAGTDGRWVVVFAPLAAQATGSDLVVAGKGEARARDVVVGEVWLCAGGSGAAAAAGARPQAAGGAAPGGGADPLVRQYTVAARAAREGEPVGGGWTVGTPGESPRFSALGLAFARDLQARLGRPFGIIACARAGAPLLSWMSPAALGAAAAAGGPAGSDEPAASSTFNGLVQPLLPEAIRGIIWYGGEGDVGRATEYAVEFPRLIAAWRRHFGQGDLPFLWVQMAGDEAAGEGSDEARARLREAQGRALVLSSTGQAVATDLRVTGRAGGAALEEAGRRLSLLAKAVAYSIPVDDTGPVFGGMAVEGPAVRVRFSPAGDGLTASGKPLQSFELAGADRVFHPAVAVIDGDSVVVRAVAVAQPVAVRYGWRDCGEANLYNGAGLPAAPFRSDDW